METFGWETCHFFKKNRTNDLNMNIMLYLCNELRKCLPLKKTPKKYIQEAQTSDSLIVGCLSVYECRCLAIPLSGMGGSSLSIKKRPTG